MCVVAGVLAAPDLQGAETPAAVRVPVTVDTDRGPVTVRAEIADDPQERNRGLMYRQALGEREGMLFVFPAPAALSFWMKNTLIPLDIIFIRPDRTILGIVAEAAPRTLTPRQVRGRSQYVLELAGGEAARLGFAPGQSVRFMVPPAVR